MWVKRDRRTAHVRPREKILMGEFLCMYRDQTEARKTKDLFFEPEKSDPFQSVQQHSTLQHQKSCFTFCSTGSLPGHTGPCF